MNVLIRINKAIYNAAKKVARAESRAISKQIELWARFGKLALENPDLPTNLIADILVARQADKSLAEPFCF